MREEDGTFKFNQIPFQFDPSPVQSLFNPFPCKLDPIPVHFDKFPFQGREIDQTTELQGPGTMILWISLHSIRWVSLDSIGFYEFIIVFHERFVTILIKRSFKFKYNRSGKLGFCKQHNSMSPVPHDKHCTDSYH